MMNKPTVLQNGTWLLPIGLWACETSPLNQLPEPEHRSFVYASRDRGKSFQRLGGADVPNRCFDEHLVIERRDGSLWMLVRRFDGIGESFSYDGGLSWTPGQKSRPARRQFPLLRPPPGGWQPAAGQPCGHGPPKPPDLPCSAWTTERPGPTACCWTKGTTSPTPTATRMPEA